MVMEVMIPTLRPEFLATLATDVRLFLRVASIPIQPLTVFSPQAIAVPLAAESVINSVADLVVVIA